MPSLPPRRSAWPHRFTADYRITVGDHLAMALDVTNTGDTPLTFEAALHTYVAVKDIRQVGVTGLAGAEYLDKVEAFGRKREGDAPIRFAGETDDVPALVGGTCRAGDAEACAQRRGNCPSGSFHREISMRPRLCGSPGGNSRVADALQGVARSHFGALASEKCEPVPPPSPR